MKKFNYEIGRFGEDLSLAYLKRKGHVILQRNFRYKRGEIDIISKTLENILVFTEVKSRYTTSYGHPIESVTYYKQKQIINISNIYLIKHNLYDYNVRYDVVEVILNTKNNTHIINHYEDAFRMS